MKSALKILVIDDEPVVLHSVERVCAGEGIAVDTAGDGRIGLERVEQQGYGLILCDMIMEGVDGLAFLAEMARRGNRTPVVMMTGCSTGENAISALQSGAVEFLAKPFTPDELMAVIRRASDGGGQGEAHRWPRVPPDAAPEAMNFNPERGTP